MAKKSTSPSKKKTQSTRSRQSKRSAKARSTERADKHVSGLDLVAEVLIKANEPMAAKAIAEQVIQAGWQTKGKTPHATLYSAMIREIEKRGKDARFKKVGRGQFAANGKVIA